MAVVLEATQRTERGRRASRLMRKNGLIPAVIYGHGQPTVSVTLNKHDVELAIKHGERLLEVQVDGKGETVLLKDLQWDTFGQIVLHLDLTRVDLDERVHITVPIILRGTPVGAIDGGVMQQMASEVEIEVAVRDMPDDIRISVAALAVGDTLHMSDLELPAGAKLLSDADMLVCSVTLVAEEAEAEPAEGEEAAGGPEVIGATPDEDEEAGS